MLDRKIACAPDGIRTHILAVLIFAYQVCLPIPPQGLLFNYIARDAGIEPATG